MSKKPTGGDADLPQQSPPASKLFNDYEARARGRRYARIIAKTWTDENFKAHLISDPESVFADYELSPPIGFSIRVVEDPDESAAENELLFVLPPKPKGWVELDSKPLTISAEDDWLDGAPGPATDRPKPRTPFPCSKCWNGCC